jgi:hypothetical protein
MNEKKIHLKLSDVKLDNDNLEYMKLTGEICGKLRDDLVRLFSGPTETEAIDEVPERQRGFQLVSGNLNLSTDFKFAEWCASNYVRLNKVWCNKYNDQTDSKNWKTTEQLFEIYGKHKISSKEILIVCCGSGDKETMARYLIQKELNQDVEVIVGSDGMETDLLAIRPKPKEAEPLVFKAVPIIDMQYCEKTTAKGHQRPYKYHK